MTHSSGAICQLLIHPLRIISNIWEQKWGQDFRLSYMHTMGVKFYSLGGPVGSSRGIKWLSRRRCLVVQS